MLGMGIIAPLMPLYAKNMGASGIWLGIIFSSYSLSRLVFVPLIGKASDKKGRKKIIAIGLFLYSLFSLAYVFAGNVYLLSLVRFFQGFASAMILPIIMAFIGDISPKGQEGKYIGYFNVSRFLGLGMGPLLGGVLNDAYGIDSAFYALTSVTALAFLLALFFLPEDKFYLQQNNGKGNHSYKGLLKLKVMRGLLIFRFVSALGRGSLMSFLSIYAFSFKITTFQVGIMLTTNILFLSFLQIPFGKIADRFSKLRIIMTGGVLTVISLVLVPMTSNFYLLLLLNVFWGTGRALGIPATSAINTIIGRRYGMGISTSLYMMALSAGMVVAPLISGILMQTVGIRYVFYFAGLATFVGILVFYLQVKGINLNELPESSSSHYK